MLGCLADKALIYGLILCELVPFLCPESMATGHCSQYIERRS